MRGYIDLTGQTYGRLTVIGRSVAPPNPKRVLWDCVCSCGQTTVVKGYSLRNGETKSCGCLRVENCTRLFADPRRKYSNRKEKQKAYYSRNSEKQKNRGRKRYEIGVDIVSEAKNKFCLDCGKRYHYSLMDFDHLPENGKEFSISKLMGRVSPHILREEIAKCDVVCALCHRIRTWNRTHPDDTISLCVTDESSF